MPGELRRKRKLRLEESTEPDHQSPGGYGEVLIFNLNGSEK